jgi:hypothetical protein
MTVLDTTAHRLRMALKACFVPHGGGPCGIRSGWPDPLQSSRHYRAGNSSCRCAGVLLVALIGKDDIAITSLGDFDAGGAGRHSNGNSAGSSGGFLGPSRGVACLRCAVRYGKLNGPGTRCRRRQMDELDGGENHYPPEGSPAGCVGYSIPLQKTEGRRVLVCATIIQPHGLLRGLSNQRRNSWSEQ